MSMLPLCQVSATRPREKNLSSWTTWNLRMRLKLWFLIAYGRPVFCRSNWLEFWFNVSVPIDRRRTVNHRLMLSYHTYRLYHTCVPCDWSSLCTTNTGFSLTNWTHCLTSMILNFAQPTVAWVQEQQKHTDEGSWSCFAPLFFPVLLELRSFINAFFTRLIPIILETNRQNWPLNLKNLSWFNFLPARLFSLWVLDVSGLCGSVTCTGSCTYTSNWSTWDMAS